MLLIVTTTILMVFARFVKSDTNWMVKIVSFHNILMEQKTATIAQTSPKTTNVYIAMMTITYKMESVLLEPIL